MSSKNEGSSNTPEAAPSLSLSQIQTLLTAKDDTSRFTGLALLKSVLDNSQDIRQDEETVVQLWSSISPRFLDRLIKTGAKSRSESGKNGREMLSLAVSVIHAFANLLPDGTKREESFVGRVAPLMGAILPRYAQYRPVFSAVTDSKKLQGDHAAHTASSRLHNELPRGCWGIHENRRS